MSTRQQKIHKIHTASRDDKSVDILDMKDRNREHNTLQIVISDNNKIKEIIIFFIMIRNQKGEPQKYKE